MSVECERKHDVQAKATVEYQAADDESLSRAVLEAVSRASGREIVDLGDDGVETLPPLFEAVDPEALDSLFHSDREEPTLGCVSFTYFDYEVVVDSAGTVTVAPVQSPIAAD